MIRVLFGSHGAKFFVLCVEGVALVYKVLDVVVEYVCRIVKIPLYLECFTSSALILRLDDF